jgi:c-di-GMP-related signal transduction protein
MEVFVARQAIFDRKRQLYAYELLYRSDAGRNQFDGTDAALATRQVISSTMLSIGLENILCGKKAFLNFDHRLLSDGMHLSLPRQSIVIEILETVDPTADLIALCQNIHDQGYVIALDDFVAQPRFEPLTQIANVIKVDFQSTPKVEQERLLRTYQAKGITMLAEKVETDDEFAWARQAGYDLFQGYFFARPVIVSGRQIPAVKTTCLRLLRETQAVDLDFERLEALVGGDVSLTFKLLRYANSALFARREKTRSIARALVVLGEEGIRRWVALATLPMLATAKPSELVTLSIVRARFCERLAQLSGATQPGDAFMMGMFSLLDALVDWPLDEALREVDLGLGVTEALLGTAPEENVLAKLYRLTRRYELGDWSEVEELSQEIGVPAGAVGAAYVESALWAERRLREDGD